MKEFKISDEPELIELTIKNLQEKIKHLEQENARMMESGCEQCKHLDLYIKYKQTLQEIKEICKNSHTSASEDYYRTADKILNLITKAEVGE